MGGPSITIKCYQFGTESPDETSLYWKAREGWRSIKTTAFGLKDPLESMDEYISQCTLFYRQGSVSSLGYVGCLLKVVKGNLQVRITACNQLRELRY